MKRIKMVFLLICFATIVNAQKLLRSTYSEINAQFIGDPNVHKVTRGQAGSSWVIFVSLKSGDKYSFTFEPNSDKLYAMTLVCSNDNATNQRFTAEVQRRRASIQDNNNYVFIDEQGRQIFLWLSYDDLGRRVINWEAKFPFKFD